MKAGELLAGKYRIEHVLGVGGVGRVVSAVHEQLEQRVAIKFLLRERMGQPESIKRFFREARIVAKLRSENVGRVIDVGELNDGTPYIVMEHLDGVDLKSHLDSEGALPPAVAVDYTLQACEAIAEAHALGLVHRDIKPANLFLTQKTDGSPLIKVLDFGISKVSESDPSFNMTQSQAVMGSPGYMSPEQLRSSKDVDARSDIWSIGVSLFELLSKTRPFRGDTFSHLCINVATLPPAPLSVPGLDPELVHAIFCCLEKDPARRFQNLAELTAALEPFGTATGVAARVGRVLQVSPKPPTQPFESGALDMPTPSRSVRPTTLSGGAVSIAHLRPLAGRKRRWVVGGVMGVGFAMVTLIAILRSGEPGSMGETSSVTGEAVQTPQGAAENRQQTTSVAQAPLAFDAAVSNPPLLPDAGIDTDGEEMAPEIAPLCDLEKLNERVRTMEKVKDLKVQKELLAQALICKEEGFLSTREYRLAKRRILGEGAQKASTAAPKVGASCSVGTFTAVARTETPKPGVVRSAMKRLRHCKQMGKILPGDYGRLQSALVRKL